MRPQNVDLRLGNQTSNKRKLSWHIVKADGGGGTNYLTMLQNSVLCNKLRGMTRK